MIKTVNGKWALMFIFIFIISLLFICNIKTLIGLFKTEVRAIFFTEYRSELMRPPEIEVNYDSNFYRKLDFVDINGITHKVLSQRIVNSAIKADNGQLFLTADLDYKFNKDAEQAEINDALAILDCAKQNGAEILYVKRPYKFDDKTNALPYGMDIQIDDQFDYWYKIISEKNINSMDLESTIGGAVL